jgi:hypothetical protein
MASARETKKALIVVRTYPTPAKQGIEVSCTAAITDTGEWLRLFPVPYRFLTPDKRFRKYQWIRVSTSKPSKDTRPESYKIEDNSIEILSEPLSTDNGWRARKEIVLARKDHCLCCLKKVRDARGFPTLGVFRPKTIERLIIEPEENPNWTDEEVELLKQGQLFGQGPKADLEKVPFKFRYVFRCEHDDCPGHKLMCTDWEMGESWRRWKDDYGDKWQENFRLRYEQEMIEKNDTHFYVGTVHRNPGAWIIVGLFYPPKPVELPLFPA